MIIAGQLLLVPGLGLDPAGLQQGRPTASLSVHAVFEVAALVLAVLFPLHARTLPMDAIDGVSPAAYPE